MKDLCFGLGRQGKLAECQFGDKAEVDHLHPSCQVPTGKQSPLHTGLSNGQRFIQTELHPAGQWDLKQASLGCRGQMCR